MESRGGRLTAALGTTLQSDVLRAGWPSRDVCHSFAFKIIQCSTLLCNTMYQVSRTAPHCSVMRLVKFNGQCVLVAFGKFGEFGKILKYSQR